LRYFVNDSAVLGCSPAGLWRNYYFGVVLVEFALRVLMLRYVAEANETLLFLDPKGGICDSEDSSGFFKIDFRSL